MHVNKESLLEWHRINRGEKGKNGQTKTESHTVSSSEKTENIRDSLSSRGG